MNTINSTVNILSLTPYHPNFITHQTPKQTDRDVNSSYIE